MNVALILPRVVLREPMPTERPILLCLNLRHEHRAPNDDSGWIEPAKTVLEYARGHSWRIGHFYRCVAKRAGSSRGSIVGLEPLVGEPVSRVGAVAAEVPWLEDWIAESSGARIYIIGVSVERFVERLCGDRNHRRVRSITVLSDAGPISEVAPTPRHHTSLRVVRTRDLVGDERSRVIIDLDARRAARNDRSRGAGNGGKLGEE